MKKEPTCEKLKEKLSKHYTPQEVSDKLGMHLHSVYRLMNQGKIKYIKKSGLAYISHDNYDEYIESFS